jgi:glycosyltransferase involved in cell wall biosynthesis
MKYSSSISIIFLGNYPHGMAMSKRIHLYAKSLKDCDIYPLIFTLDNRDKNYSSIQHYNGVDFITNPLIDFKIGYLNSFISKILILVQYLRYSKNNKVVWLIGHSWFFTFSVRLITFFQGRKLIVETNEYPYVTYGDRRLNFKLISKINQYIAIKLIYPLLDGFVVISDALEQAVKKWNKKATVIRIPILVNFNEHLIQDKNKFKQRFSEPYLFHAGTLNEQKDGILYVFEAFARIALKHTNLKFILTNDVTIAATKAKINKIIEEYKLSEKVIFYNGLTNENVEYHLQHCSFAILNKPVNLQNNCNFSTKLGEYLMYGVPLITTLNGEAEKYLANKNCCFRIEENSVVQMVEMMDKILTDNSIVQEKITNAQNLAKEFFDYRNYSNLLSRFIKSF